MLAQFEPRAVQKLASQSGKSLESGQENPDEKTLQMLEAQKEDVRRFLLFQLKNKKSDFWSDKRTKKTENKHENSLLVEMFLKTA